MALPTQRETVTFRDAHLIFKNFKGEERQFNPVGQRNFSILLGEEQAKDLEANGWNVKPLRRQEEDDEQLYHLKTKVAFGNYPPRCWLITSGGRTMLGEGLIGILDEIQSVKVDLVISAYNWKLKSGASGRSAYLQSLFYTMLEDELELEYASVPQIGSAGDGAPTPLAIDSEEIIEAEVVD